MKIKSGIYQWRNVANGKVYVGSAVDLVRRNRQHLHLLNYNKHYNNMLQAGFNKYGPEQFVFEIIETVEDLNKLVEREQHFIDTLNPGYNIRKIANSNIGVKWSAETIAKRQASRKGYKWTEETRLKFRLSMNALKERRGYIVHPDHQRKLQELNTGSKRREETKKRMSEAASGKKKDAVF